MAKSKGHPDYLKAADRRVAVFELKKQGGSYRAIAAKMIRDYKKSRLPKGYDERYVYKDVMVVLDQLNEELRESADVVRRLEIERLDLMFMKNFERAVKGDDSAVLSCTRIMQRRARLLGLDAPTKNELSGLGGSDIQINVNVVDD